MPSPRIVGADAPVPRPATTRIVTQINRTAILDAVRGHGSLTRREIQVLTGLSPATVERLCSALLQERLLVKDGLDRPRRGRPSVRYRYGGRERVVAAVEVLAERVRGRLVDLDGHVVLEAPDLLHEAEASDRDGSHRIPTTLRMIDALLAQADALSQPCVTMGVSVPGVVSAVDGRITNAMELGWQGLALGDILRSRHDLPIVIENDANAIAYGEWSRGAGVGSGHLVALVLEYGAGAGIVTGGQLLRGHRSAAGEIGYLLADRSVFGQQFALQGDLESRIAALVPPTGLADLLDRAAAGDPEVERDVAEIFDYVGLACAALSAVLDPEVIVLGGQLARRPEFAVDQVRRRLVGRITFPPRLAPSVLGAEAALTGIAQLAIAKANAPTYLNQP